MGLVGSGSAWDHSCAWEVPPLLCLLQEHHETAMAPLQVVPMPLWQEFHAFVVATDLSAPHSVSGIQVSPESGSAPYDVRDPDKC